MLYNIHAPNKNIDKKIGETIKSRGGGNTYHIELNEKNAEEEGGTVE